MTPPLLPLRDIATLLNETTIRSADQPQVEPLLAAARDLQAIEAALPQLLQGIERVSEALTQGKSENPAVLGRFHANLLGAVGAVYAAAAGIYPAYKAGHARCVEMGAFWSLGCEEKPLGRGLEGFAGPSRASLLSALKDGIAALKRDVKKLDLPSSSSSLRDAAHRPPTDATGRKRVLDDGLDAFGAIAAIFPRTLGILRRASRVVDAGAQDPWVSSVVWRTDPLVGGRES